jgi:hypothetical protein
MYECREIVLYVLIRVVGKIFCSRCAPAAGKLVLFVWIHCSPLSEGMTCGVL